MRFRKVTSHCCAGSLTLAQFFYDEVPEGPAITFKLPQEQHVAALVGAVAEYFAAAELAYGHGTDNAYDEAGWLVFAVAGLDHGAAADVAGQVVDRAAASRIAELATRRVAERLPLAYLLGEAWFAGLCFASDGRALVPRSPLAELIVGGFSPWLDDADLASALDIGTGSGCIGIALAVHRGIDVVATDIDAAALALASDNAERHGVTDRVRLVHSDVYRALGDERFDLIISNPPYVDAPTMDGLPDEYRHEPQHALAAGNDGLQIVREILAGARNFLSDRGVVVVEVGDTEAALDAAFPDLALTWLEMADGASGIFLVTRTELERWAAAGGR